MPHFTGTLAVSKSGSEDMSGSAKTMAQRDAFTKQTIALVDDDRNILTSVSMTLEQEGFQVRTYTDGESALQGLSARPADLAVLDIKMPRMDGMELLQRLRLRSSMPVIFLTSKDEEVDQLMGLVSGRTTTSRSRSASGC